MLFYSLALEKQSLLPLGKLGEFECHALVFYR